MSFEADATVIWGEAQFSQAALTKWHRGPTKTSRSQLETLFRSVGLQPTVTRSYLDGMLLAATAIVVSD